MGDGGNEVSVDKKSEGFGLKLVGDFDATS